MFSAADLLQLANRDYILGNATTEEQIAFINDQIDDPFGSGNTNYYRMLKKSVPSKDALDEIIKDFFVRIMDVYPKLTIDVDDYDGHLSEIFPSIYKFFVKNIQRMMYVFIREFIFNNKNRKGLIATFSSTKTANYPKEQYGKKDYYILITKLPNIVDEIFDDDIKLKKFIKYIAGNPNAPTYLDQLKDLIDRDILVDKGIVEYMYKMYKKSDNYRGDLNRLEMEITSKLIIPYMRENGMESIRIPPTEEIVLDEDDEDEEAD